MIEIRSISGNVLLSVPVLKDAVSHEELMASDYVQLKWDSDKGGILPAGSYIDHDGERYSLLEPYYPTRDNEVTFRYNPQFQYTYGLRASLHFHTGSFPASFQNRNIPSFAP